MPKKSVSCDKAKTCMGLLSFHFVSFQNRNQVRQWCSMACLWSFEMFEWYKQLLGKNRNIFTLQSLTLSLVNTFCVPSLMCGWDDLRLIKSQIRGLSYPFNSVFIKLFYSVDIKNVARQCQFYCEYWSFNHLIDLRVQSFYKKLGIYNASSAR